MVHDPFLATDHVACQETVPVPSLEKALVPYLEKAPVPYYPVLVAYEVEIGDRASEKRDQESLKQPPIRIKQNKKTNTT